MKKIIPMLLIYQTILLSANVHADDGLLKSQFVFDYRDYARAANITQKTFTTDDPVCGQLETRSYTDVLAGDNTEVAVRRVRRDALGAVCQNRVFNYLKTPSERLLISKENWNKGGSVLNSTDVIDSPVVTQKAWMFNGKTFGSASTVTRVSETGSSSQGAIVETHAALGLEDITVPYGSFTGCLKVSTSRDSVVLGGSFNRISWFCTGVGEVQRIQGSNGTTKIWQLTGVVSNP